MIDRMCSEMKKRGIKYAYTAPSEVRVFEPSKVDDAWIQGFVDAYNCMYDTYEMSYEHNVVKEEDR